MIFFLNGKYSLRMTSILIDKIADFVVGCTGSTEFKNGPVFVIFVSGHYTQ